MTTEKDALLNAIEKSQQRLLAEQTRLKNAVLSVAQDTMTAEQMVRLRTIGWAGLLAGMADVPYPPSENDWVELLDQAWHETPKRQMLSRITDEDVRHATYFFSEMSDHVDRIRARGAFLTLVGPKCAETDYIFDLWAHRTVLMELRDSEMARDTGTRAVLQALVRAHDILGDHVMGDLPSLAATLQRLHDAFRSTPLPPAAFQT